jgi:hypothetical protein
MKKMMVLVLVSLFCVSICAQKKKPIAKKSTSIVLAKAANLSAEIVKDNFYLFINNVNSKDTIVLKKVDVKNLPSNCKITVFTTKETPLYLITWIEKITIKTDLKTEDIINLHSEIYELSSKKQVVANIQITKNITEKVFLDKLKNASETQQRIRREGFEFILLPNGDVTLKNKTQENKLTYSTIDKKYVDAKLPSKPSTTKPPITKKKR